MTEIVNNLYYLSRLTKKKKLCAGCCIEFKPCNNGQKYCSFGCRDKTYIKKYSKGKTLWARRFKEKYPLLKYLRQRESSKKYYYKNKGNEDWDNKIKSRVKSYLNRNPERKSAYILLHNYIRLGRIIRPDYCSKCGNSCRIEAHHEDYKEPLRVEWLCRKCHLLKHKKLSWV